MRFLTIDDWHKHSVPQGTNYANSLLGKIFQYNFVSLGKARFCWNAVILKDTTSNFLSDIVEVIFKKFNMSLV